MKASSRRASSAIGSVLLNIAALGGLLCIALVILAFVFNISLIMFKTGSMSPTIPAGSVAVVREIPATEIEVGDVVTVERSDQLPVTHRVTAITGEGDSRTITMRGDANAVEDPEPYVVTEVRRVITSAPGLARVVIWFSNPWILGALTIGASVLVTWAFWPRTPRYRGEHSSPRSDNHTDSDPHDGMAIPTAVLSGVVLLVGTALAFVPASPAEALPGPLAKVSGVQAMIAGSEAEVVHSDHLTLTSIGDAVAMRSMTPGVPVVWQVGVTANAPEPGRIDVFVEGAGSHALGFSAEIRVCGVQWVNGFCAGKEYPVPADGVFDLETGAVRIATMAVTEERWALITVLVMERSAETVELTVRAVGAGDQVATGLGGHIGSMPITGAGMVLAPWLACGAVFGGLIITSIVRIVRYQSITRVTS